MIDLNAIANDADLIVNGYAFIKSGERIDVVNMNHCNGVASFDSNGKLLCTTMPDIEIGIIRHLYQLNHDLIAE